MNSFLSRLTFIVAGRKKHQWGQSVGIKKGTVENIFKGSVPASETLSAIAKTENVSITWLLEGRGAPFIVASPATDTEAIEMLEDTLSENGWASHVLKAGKQFAMVLTKPAQFQQKDGEIIDYTAVEIIGGDCGESSSQWLLKNHQLSICYVNISPEEIMRLKRGEMGNQELLGWRDIDGILSPCPTVVEQQQKTPSNAIPKLHLVQAQSPTQIICHNIKRLDKKELLILEGTIKALLESEGKEWEPSAY